MYLSDSMGKLFPILASKCPRRIPQRCRSFHSPVGNIKIVNVLMGERVADDPPVALVVIRLFIEPQMSG